MQTAPWLLWTDLSEPSWYEPYLLGLMSTRIVDWWARRFVEGHVDEEAFNCLRVPDPTPALPLAKRAVALAGRLAAPDDRFAAWAKSIGVAHGPLKPDEKQNIIEELDAVVAHLYGLSESKLVHIFETFHEGRDYQDQLDRTLRHFHSIAKHP